MQLVRKKQPSDWQSLSFRIHFVHAGRRKSSPAPTTEGWYFIILWKITESFEGVQKSNDLTTKFCWLPIASFKCPLTIKACNISVGYCLWEVLPLQYTFFNCSKAYDAKDLLSSSWNNAWDSSEGGNIQRMLLMNKRCLQLGNLECSSLRGLMLFIRKYFKEQFLEEKYSCLSDGEDAAEGRRGGNRGIEHHHGYGRAQCCSSPWGNSSDHSILLVVSTSSVPCTIQWLSLLPLLDTSSLLQT